MVPNIAFGITRNQLQNEFPGFQNGPLHHSETFSLTRSPLLSAGAGGYTNCMYDVCGVYVYYMHIYIYICIYIYIYIYIYTYTYTECGMKAYRYEELEMDKHNISRHVFIVGTFSSKWLIFLLPNWITGEHHEHSNSVCENEIKGIKVDCIFTVCIGIPYTFFF